VINDNITKVAMKIMVTITERW